LESFMKFAGFDLTSAFAQDPRPNDVAVLDEGLNVQFFLAHWPTTTEVTNRTQLLLDAMLAPIWLDSSEPIVLALDGPQGLATMGQAQRACEQILGTPGRTPSQLPPPEEAGIPFQGYIRSCVDLFRALVDAGHHLAGLNGQMGADVGLWEVFPGAEWIALAGQRLAGKASRQGRQERRDLFQRLGVNFGNADLPSADQHDALVGAYLAWCVHHRSETVESVGIPPFIAAGEIREGLILHARNRADVNPPSIQPLAIQPSTPEGRTRTADAAQGPAEDWNDDRARLLLLTDFGLVHGTEPENAWLVAGENYIAVTLPPDIPILLTLTHAPSFSGGRGWRVNPRVKSALEQLGRPVPDHLGRDDAVTLRVAIV
jgi:hypothetical protein